MALIKFSALLMILTIINQSLSNPGHHVHHRIHIPTKVKTIYHTKIIKVPEHHHYIHEKEKPKLIKIPEHHHYFHEKEKEKLVDLHDFHHQESEHSFPPHDYENEHHRSSYEQYKEEEHNVYKDYKDHNVYKDHNIYKKHAPPHLYKRKKH